jgi:hypothetical protein
MTEVDLTDYDVRDKAPANDGAATKYLICLYEADRDIYVPHGEYIAPGADCTDEQCIRHFLETAGSKPAH